jgi:hypothetical protein
LDEDEFDALALDKKTRQQALDGLLALRELFSGGKLNAEGFDKHFTEGQG